MIFTPAPMIEPSPTTTSPVISAESNSTAVWAIWGGLVAVGVEPAHIDSCQGWGVNGRARMGRQVDLAATQRGKPGTIRAGGGTQDVRRPPDEHGVGRD